MQLTGKILLAPMAGITDPVFRTLCRSHGADIVVSEMVSADALLHNSKATEGLFTFVESERPIGIQLFGSNPDSLSRAASIIEQTVHPDFIDLNSGCPVPKVVKKNGGAALLRDPHMFEKIVSSMAKAITIPLTVKIRSGWNTFQWVDEEFARIAEGSGARALVLHPRSQKMSFSGHSFWERIAIVKNVVKIPVVGNGDIESGEDAVKMFKETGCDAVMVGRATYGNPWIFNEIKCALQGSHFEPVSQLERGQTALTHLHRYIDMYGEHKATGEMKKHLAWYIKGITGASQARNSLFRADTTAELESITRQVFGIL